MSRAVLSWGFGFIVMLKILGSEDLGLFTGLRLRVQLQGLRAQRRKAVSV